MVTWTLKSSNDAYFIVYSDGDFTSVFWASMRIKLTQSEIKYFILTHVALVAGKTELTLFGMGVYEVGEESIGSLLASTRNAKGFPATLIWPGVVEEEVPTGSGTTITVEHAPLAGTLQLFKRGQLYNGGFSVSGKNIILEESGVGSEFLAYYKF